MQLPETLPPAIVLAPAPAATEAVVSPEAPAAEAPIVEAVTETPEPAAG